MSTVTLTNAPTILACLLLAGCATTTQQAPTDLKRCAQALVVMKASANCTALAPICTFTMADLLVAETAAADKQNYCPSLRDGEEGANN